MSVSDDSCEECGGTHFDEDSADTFCSDCGTVVRSVRGGARDQRFSHEFAVKVYQPTYTRRQRNPTTGEKADSWWYHSTHQRPTRNYSLWLLELNSLMERMSLPFSACHAIRQELARATRTYLKNVNQAVGTIPAFLYMAMKESGHSVSIQQIVRSAGNISRKHFRASYYALLRRRRTGSELLCEPATQTKLCSKSKREMAFDFLSRYDVGALSVTKALRLFDLIEGVHSEHDGEALATLCWFLVVQNENLCSSTSFADRGAFNGVQAQLTEFLNVHGVTLPFHRGKRLSQMVKKCNHDLSTAVHAAGRLTDTSCVSRLPASRRDQLVVSLALAL